MFHSLSFFSILFHKDKIIISRPNLDKTYPLHVPGILFSKINRFLHISLIFKRCRSPKQWRDTIGAVVEQSARSKEWMIFNNASLSIFGHLAPMIVKIKKIGSKNRSLNSIVLRRSQICKSLKEKLRTWLVGQEFLQVFAHFNLQTFCHQNIKSCLDWEIKTVSIIQTKQQNGFHSKGLQPALQLSWSTYTLLLIMRQSIK